VLKTPMPPVWQLRVALLLQAFLHHPMLGMPSPAGQVRSVARCFDGDSPGVWRTLHLQRTYYLSSLALLTSSKWLYSSSGEANCMTGAARSPREATYSVKICAA
jgi:hypothetical protein